MTKFEPAVENCPAVLVLVPGIFNFLNHAIQR